jgi:hypothetical protein
MQLNDLFHMLAYGELSNHHIASAGDGTLALTKQPQIVHFANEALVRLYTKFILKEKDCIVELQEGITIYRLTPEYATTSFDSSIASAPYIRDTLNEPFQDDVLKVLAVYTNYGGHRPLNDANNCWSVNTPSAKTLQVNLARTDEVLAVTYQAKHPTLDDTDQEIELPATLHGALTAFIAYKVFFNMNTPESQAISQGHLAMFNNICADTTEADALNLSISGVNTRFNLGGWK